MVSETVTEAQRGQWASRRLLLVGLWLTLLLLAMKVWIAWATRSLSLASAALHTLVTSFSLLLGVLAVSSPHQRHKLWGHTRLETSLTLLLVSFLGAAYCFLVGVAAYQVGFLPEMNGVTNLNMSIWQLLATMTASSLGLSLTTCYWLRNSTNSLLQFSFGQTLQDAGLMLVVLASLVGTGLGIDWLDPVVAGLVLLVVVFHVWQVVNWQLPTMMRQVAIAPEAIAHIAHQVEGVLHCYNIHTRGMVGRMVNVELRLIVHPECVAVAPAIKQRLKYLLTQQYGLVEMKIHIDPVLPGATNHRKS